MKLLEVSIPAHLRSSISKKRPSTIYLRLRGGLGNQLFIYFAGLYYADKFDMNLEVDTRGADHDFDISAFSLPGKFSRNRVYWKYVDLRHLRDRVLFESDVVKSPSEIINKSHSFLLEGFFQDFCLYLGLKRNGIRITAPASHLLPGFHTIHGQGSALIHIRGGDYLNNRSSIGCLDSKYYNQIRKILSAKKVESIFVLTDDEVHARSLLSDFNESQISFIEKGSLQDYEYLAYFSIFKYVFLANSTYSWWGAQLVGSNCKVFSPSKWSKNGLLDATRLNLKEWQLIDSSWLD